VKIKKILIGGLNWKEKTLLQKEKEIKRVRAKLKKKHKLWLKDKNNKTLTKRARKKIRNQRIRTELEKITYKIL